MLALITALAILSPTIVIAEDSGKTIDMAQLTCEEFTNLGRMEKMMSLVWLSGWAGQRQGNFTFSADRTVMTKRKDNLEAACENNEKALVIEQLIPRRVSN
ncbi:MAG: HdeA/HdeB family chaperone [Cyanobacteria bacterium P01_A01_bin.40]